MDQKKTHFDEIDIAKGIGICFVVFGHALKQIEVESSVIAAMLLVIHSFHMPLFFMLSGFVSAKLLRMEREDRPGYVKARASRLLTPYFVMSLLYLPLKMALSSVALRPYDLSSSWRILIGQSPDTTIWYLYILFWCHIVSVTIVRKNNLPWVLAAAFVVSAAAHIFAWPLKLPGYFVFFVLGLFIREHYDTFLSLFRGKYVALAAVCFIGIQIASLTSGKNLSFPVAPLSGTFLVWFISHRIAGKETVSKKTWTRLGSMSMDIYVLSDPIMICLRIVLSTILGLSLPVCIALFFVLSIALAYLASTLVIRKSRILRFLFLGMH